MGKKSKRQGFRAAAAEGRDTLDAALARLWKSIGAHDVLEAEVGVSELLALPDLSDDSAESLALFVDALIDRGARALEPPDHSAYLRLLMTLGTRAVKRQASEELAELTDGGTYPPEWVTGIGKPVPGRAYRAAASCGDQEAVVVTFSYGDREHAIMVLLDRSELPTVIMAGLNANADDLLKHIGDDPMFDGGLTPIPLDEARRRIEVPVASYGLDPLYEPDLSSVFALPLVRARVRRLPAPAPDAAAAYTAADRAVAVAEFLASPLAAEAGPSDTARFWAQVLTGYSSRVPDEPPASVGKFRLSAALLLHVPRTFELSGAQLDGMRPAVTAWTHWAAARQGVGKDGAAELVTGLDEALDEFPEVYEAAGLAGLRGYVLDQVTPEVDLAWLADLRARRELAVPSPEDRDPDDVGADATSPAGRATVTASEFASCAPDDPDSGRFLDTARRVVEELWHDEPTATWQAAKGLLAKGLDPHDVIHQLVESRS